MPPRRTPIKGEPDFTNVSTESLQQYKDCVQQLIHAYKGVSNDVVVQMQKVWKDLSDVVIERVADEAIKSIDSESKPVSRRIKPVRVRR